MHLDEEIYEIEEEYERSIHKEKFYLETKLAVRVDDLTRHFIVMDPHVVHFSGHGSITSEIVLQDKNRRRYRVPANALENLFEQFKDTVQCVLLNACYSEDQARAIAKHVSCVIGMSSKIRDKSARTFAKGFYRGIFNGSTIENSFKMGIRQMELVKVPGDDIPIIIPENGPCKDIKLV